MVPFGDYQLIREVAERFPGSVDIVRGEVLFNDDYINEAWYNPFSWGKGQPQQPPVDPSQLMTQQQTPQLYQPKPGQIDTVGNPGFKADVQSLRQVVKQLQTPKLQSMMKQWMGKIFTKIPSMNQQTVGANQPAPMDASGQPMDVQGSEMGGAVNQPAMSQSDTSVPMNPVPDQTGQYPLPGMENPADQERMAQLLAPQSYDTFGNYGNQAQAGQTTQTIHPMNPMNPMNQQNQKKAAMWKSMWKS